MMSYCLNPKCQKPQNPDGTNFCQSCGSKLLLKERYRAIQPLGAGGFGRTLKAVDRDRLNHPCVIKQFLLPPEQNQKATELFNQEAKRLYELGKHPQIPDLLAHFEQDNYLYLVQEFIDGQNLLQEMEQQGAFSEQQINHVLTDLLPILQFIHDRGVIHRDIKPENIMCRTDGKLMLIDFGVSKQTRGTLASTIGTSVGTPGYAPLEQMRGQACPASDLYSLGVTCVALLTECLPTESGSNQLYDAINGRWTWRTHLPVGTTISLTMGLILDKLLCDFVRERYQSAAEVLPDLNLHHTAITIINPQPAAFVSNTPQPVVSVLLESERGIDYTKLRDLLAAKKWKEADEETRNKMLEVMGQQKGGYLTSVDIETFPCKDLCTINHLWVRYSDGRFGFSVQKRIWMEVGGKPGVYGTQVYERFGDRVGWRANNKWKSYPDLTFTLNAYPGHLPTELPYRSYFFTFTTRWGCWFFFSRVETCKV